MSPGELPAAETLHSGVNADVVTAAERALGAVVVLWNRAGRDLEVSLSPIQLQTIEIIARHGEVNLRGLASELDAIPSSASRLCDRMEAAGLVIREGALADRREVVLRLTEEGQALFAELSERRKSVVAEALAGMTSASQRCLIDALTEFGRLCEQPDAAQPDVVQPPIVRDRSA
ncbi:MarR family winged helix-turn-helix transcriptional regulator [Actinomadura soli]|uniref:MarR family winged helix-turn-helix transcriptional regulator n=1 Tax=Actinomadura soli TaxID=2508997 RepID=UPI0014875D7A|nr:MarR family transcriptional regulator [Actinomadura soli]